MQNEFQKEMGRYIASRRKSRGIFSSGGFNRLGSTFSVRVEQPKSEGKEAEITQEAINSLIEKQRGMRGTMGRIDSIMAGGEAGWKEINLEEYDSAKSASLGGERRKIEENLLKISRREIDEKRRLVQLSRENKQREAESNEERMRRLELEEEIKILREKERIEEEKLSNIRRARRIEQMSALRGRVSEILFRSRNSRVEGGAVKRVSNVEGAELDKIKRAMVTGVKQKEEIKAKEPKKSFFSNFIQIRTAEQIAKEEEERLKIEGEQALKDKSEINKILEEDAGEVRSNAPAQEPVANISTLFPEEAAQKEVNTSDDFIEIDKDYKIKVVRN